MLNRFLIFFVVVHIVVSQTVTLPDGVILGQVSLSHAGTPFHSFQKIPYAQPPIGNLRFKPPVPPKPWTGTLNTTYLDKICYQIPLELPEESEDCLYINVYTPELPCNGKNVSRPVLVFIYGGGFFAGDAKISSYGPEFLIDYDIVVVTFNYRLGPLGFLSTEDTVISGNNGLKDQHLALKWVKNNINLFGGDPDKITIAGQSAGGGSVSFQLLYKKNEGLFRGAVMESGTAINPVAIQRNARKNAFSFAAVLNDTFNNVNDSQVLLDYLLRVSAEDLDSASTQVSGWNLVIETEHDEAFITKKMYGLIKSGDFVRVPILMGMNSEEAVSQARDLTSLTNKMKSYDNNAGLLVPVDTRITDAESQRKFAEAIKKVYVGDDLFINNLGAGVRFDSDNGFTRAIIKAAELYSKFTDVYFYQFSYDGVMGNVTASIEGAERVAHSEELWYMWRTTSKYYDNSDLSKFPYEDLTTMNRLLRLWTNFVKTLNPTPESAHILQHVIWQKVTDGTETDFLYLDIGKNLTLKNHPKEETYRAWVALYDNLGFDDFDTY